MATQPFRTWNINPGSIAGPALETGEKHLESRLWAVP